jgi:hypothetical protein
MTAEKQLYDALKRIATENGQQLDDSPLADIEVPLKGGGKLVLSLELLSTAE